MNARDIDDMEDLIDPLLMRKKSGKYIAQMLVRSGYRKPRTIPDEHFRYDSTGKYPVSFKEGTIVQSADGSVWRIDDGEWDALGWGSSSLRGPATVLYDPEVTR